MEESYLKNLLETVWSEDEKLYANGDATEPPNCLRCGRQLASHLPVNAISRCAEVRICEICGMGEAIRAAAHIPLPFAEWDAVKNGRLSKI